MSEPVDPSGLPQTPASLPPVPAVEKPRKKSKARRAWITFGSRIAAQVVGAAASVTLGIFVLHKSQNMNAKPVEPQPAMRVDTARASGEIAVAVLPLSNFSGDGQDYFADGMTEALTAELAQLGGLHVISRTSTLRYKTDPKPIPEVGRELGVDFVVEGSVVRAKDRVRVTAQLINARTDEHVWARSYDRTLRDILSLQAEVASAVAKELKGALAPSASTVRRSIDPAVYDVYLRGREAWSLRTPEGFQSAIKYFTEATSKDPNFALAYAGIADSYILQPVASLAEGSADNVAKAKAAALKAIALDSAMAEAHTALAGVYFFGERNFALAEPEFRRALELNEHYATAHQWYAIALAEHRRYDEARTHAQEAVDEDPLNGTMHQAYGLVRYYARDLDTAVSEQRLALQLNPQLPLARVVLAKSLILQGKPQEAVAVCEQAPAPSTADVLLTLGIAQARSGNQRAADSVWKDLSSRRPRPSALLAQWHAAAGDYDAVFEELKQSGSTALPVVLTIDPLFEGLRADRRFASSHR